MAMKNLWGDVPIEPDQRTPAAILKGQADELGKLTNGMLEGKVVSGLRPVVDLRRIPEGFADPRVPGPTGPSLLQHRLYIVAPALEEYAYEVLSASHDPLDVFPVEVQAAETGRAACHDETAFEAAIGKVLRSDRVRKVIRSLVSQSQVA